MVRPLYFIVLIIFLKASFGFAQNGSVFIDSKFASIDAELNLILVNKSTDEINVDYPGIKRSVVINNSTYQFLSEIEEVEVGRNYSVFQEDDQNFELFFTELPVVNITSEIEIQDEPSVLASFTMCESNGNVISDYIGIEYRGGWTQSLPKKSYKIEFWNDSIGNEKVDHNLLNMRSDDDWNLQAMYNEPLRLRSKLSYSLWDKIDTLHYINDEPKAINGIRQEYIELFVNSSYHGLYTISERIDRKQLQLKKFKDGEFKGELYKGINWGAPTFTRLPDFSNDTIVWSGFEYEYPTDSIDWQYLYDLVEFVMTSDSLEFYENYKERFDVGNLVNYFIFLNLLRATDNEGKNIYVAKYTSNQPYFYVPYDLDGSFGMIWNGTEEDISNDLQANAFYRRLFSDNGPGGFVEGLRVRWNALRKSTITIQGILFEFESAFDFLSANGVYEREKLAWPECEFLNFDNLEYTKEWLESRILYLDNVFNNPELLLTNAEEILGLTEIFKIFPNPASEFINYDFTDSSFNVERIRILDNTGLPVITYKPNELQGSLDLSPLNSGIYFMLVGSNSTTTKFIKSFIKQ